MDLTTPFLSLRSTRSHVILALFCSQPSTSELLLRVRHEFLSKVNNTLRHLLKYVIDVGCMLSIKIGLLSASFEISTDIRSPSPFFSFLSGDDSFVLEIHLIADKDKWVRISMIRVGMTDEVVLPSLHVDK